MSWIRAGPNLLRVVRTGIVPVVQSTPTEDNVVSWGDDTAILEDAGFAKSNVFLVDGSRAFTSYVDFSEIAEPASPAANTMRMFAVDDSGVTTLETKDADGHVFRVHEDTFRVARNTTGVQINKGQAVYFSGSTGNKPNIALARANSEATMPAIGLAYDDIANNAFGVVLVIGHFGGIDTSAFNEGDVLYVSPTTAGALTTTRPAHPNFAQFLGTVETSSVGAGQILLSVAPAFLGRDSGTNQNNFTIGDQAAGAKTLTFDNGNLGVVSWEPTANRTVTIPDETMTLAGRNVAQTFTEAQTVAKDQDGFTTLTVSNTHTGTSAISRVLVLGPSSRNFSLEQMGPNYSGTGARQSSASVMNAHTSISLAALGTPGAGTGVIRFYVGGNDAASEKVSIDENGSVIIDGGGSASVANPAIGLNNNVILGWKDASGNTARNFIFANTSNDLQFGVDNGTKMRLKSNGHLLLNTTTDAGQLTVQGDGSDILSLKDSGGTSVVTVKNGGNVGIGTTAPSTALHVSGDTFAAAADMIAIFEEGGSIQKYTFPSSGNFFMSLGTNDNTVQFIDAAATGGTEAGYVQIEINGTTRYIRTFSTS